MIQRPIHKLGNLVEITSGFAFKSSFFCDDGGLPLIRIRDVVRGYTETCYSGDYDPKFLVQNGDLLVGMDGEFNSAFWAGDTALLNQRVCRIEPDERVLDRKYLGFFLPKELKTIENKTPHVTVKHLSAKTIKDIKIPLPPLAEQKRIATILDKADAIRRKRREAINLADTFLRSVFLKMFGDPMTNPMGWEMASLNDVISIGPQNGLYKPSSDYGSGTPIVRIDSFYSGVIEDYASLKRVRIKDAEIIKYGIKNKDILINRVNSKEHLGKSAIVDGLQEPTVFESNIMRFSVKIEKIFPLYLIDFLGTPFIKMQIRRMRKDAVNQSSINQSDVRSLQVMLPAMEAQAKYVKIKLAFNHFRDKSVSSVIPVASLFSSLQQRAFRGDL